MRDGSDAKADGHTPSQKKAAEKKRLAAALRENLKRRKVAAAERADVETIPPDQIKPGTE